MPVGCRSVAGARVLYGAGGEEARRWRGRGDRSREGGRHCARGHGVARFIEAVEQAVALRVPGRMACR